MFRYHLSSLNSLLLLLLHSENLFGAVMRGLAISGKMAEAQELLFSLESGESPSEVKPWVSCYTAILLGHVKERSWDSAIEVFELMQEQNMPVTPETVQGLVLAHKSKGSVSAVVSFLNTILDTNATIDERTFKLLVRLLLPEISSTTESSTEDIRRQLRLLGEKNPSLRVAALKLIRSVRRAEVEQNRSYSGVQDTESRIDSAWHEVLVDIVDFVAESNDS